MELIMKKTDAQKSKDYDKKHGAISVLFKLYPENSDEAEVAEITSNWKSERTAKQHFVKAVLAYKNLLK